MSSNYNGLTRNTWPGTWSPTGNHPIVLDAEIRGALRTITGNAGDQLLDIPGQRLEVGMLVYVINTYVDSGMNTIFGDKYYKYVSQFGESRDTSTGQLPNAVQNWVELQFGGGGGSGGYTGSMGYTGSSGGDGVGSIGYTGSAGYAGSLGAIGYTGSQGAPGEAAAIGYTGSAGPEGLAGTTGYTGSRGIPGYAGSSSAISVGIIDAGGNLTSTVSNVSSLKFDKDSGFTVDNLGSGTVKISTGTTGGISGNLSTFKNWVVDGQPTLTAQGTDTVKFVAGSGIIITTDDTTSPKTIYFSAPRLTVNVDCNGVTRPYGLDAYYDGGYPDSIYGGIDPLDSGGVT